MDDKLNATEQGHASLTRRGDLDEKMDARGLFVAECIGPDGKLKWRDTIENTVVTAGKNYALDGYLQTAVTIVGPYMGLIASGSFTGIVAGDIMTSHGGWLEAGGTNIPQYSGTRKTCVWSAAAAGSKSLSAALSFAMTATGTVKGAFIVLSTGALATIDNTGGTLYSAGLFTGGDRAVLSGDTVNVSYTASL
jgi:hypothetical protein